MGSWEAKVFPDVVTLGCWLRKSNSNKLKERFAKNENDKQIKLGRGVAFYIVL